MHSFIGIYISWHPLKALHQVEPRILRPAKHQIDTQNSQVLLITMWRDVKRCQKVSTSWRFGLFESLWSSQDRLKLGASKRDETSEIIWSSAFLPTWTKPIRFCVYPNVPRIAWPYPTRFKLTAALGVKAHRFTIGGKAPQLKVHGQIPTCLTSFRLACTWRRIVCKCVQSSTESAIDLACSTDIMQEWQSSLDKPFCESLARFAL